ncbi:MULTISPECIES: hypothetical protein [Bradyrhizobium]|uniref:Uncharacterized protein n=1 Tax=Bradyrhizobium septentrionale TaxID=1404411 RepID=A0ABZ2P950_9BRAD
MSEPVDAARLERALAIAAYCIARHGDYLLPILDRLRHELATSRAGAAGAAAVSIPDDEASNSSGTIASAAPRCHAVPSPHDVGRQRCAVRWDRDDER